MLPSRLAPALFKGVLCVVKGLERLARLGVGYSPSRSRFPCGRSFCAAAQVGMIALGTKPKPDLEGACASGHEDTTPP